MQVFVIYDTERPYTEKLVHMLSMRRTLPFDFHAFTDPVRLQAFLAHHRADILLVSEKDYDASLVAGCRGTLILLGEKESGRPEIDAPRVSKYQSSAALMQEVLAQIREDADEDPSYVMKGDQKVIGIYSPLGRCHKTLFALALGEQLASRRTVLYLNFEPYAALPELMHTSPSSTLSDVLYYMREEDIPLSLKIDETALPLGHMFYIPPVRVPEDIADLSGEDIHTLLSQIRALSRFETVLLDLGGGLRDIPEILSFCDLVYLPVLEDPVSQAKLSAFTEHLCSAGQEAVLHRTHRILIPPLRPQEAAGNQILLSAVLSGIGRFAGEMIRKDGL